MSYEPLNSIFKRIQYRNLILDAGAGDLKYTKILTRQGFNVIAIDISFPNKCKVKDESFILSSIEYIPFRDNVFDFIFSLSVLQYIKNDSISIKEFYRTLKSESILLFTIPSAFSVFRLLRELEIFFNLYIGYPNFNPHNYNYYTNERIKNMLSGFKLMELFGYGYNFLPRLFFLFYKLITNNRDIRYIYKDSKKELTNFYKIKNNESGENKTNIYHYKNKILVELSYHKIIICRKI
jgi:SAM-dependent methyltransferase